jgi:peptidoglycan hydrolase FlgJ
MEMVEGENRITAAVTRSADRGNVKETDERDTAEKEKKLKKACADFESILVYNLFKSMRKTVPASGLLDTFPGKDTYTMMFDQKVAEDMAHSGNGLGIQKMLFEQLNRKLLKKGGDAI